MDCKGTNNLPNGNLFAPHSAKKSRLAPPTSPTRPPTTSSPTPTKNRQSEKIIILTIIEKNNYRFNKAHTTTNQHIK